MKPTQLTIISLLLSTALLLSGCQTLKAVATKSGTDILGLAAAGAAGAYLGDAFGDGDAAKALGAAAGIAVYATAVAYNKEKDQQKYNEAYQQGLRQGRVESANEYWDEVTDANGSLVRNAQKEAKKSSGRKIGYDTRYINPNDPSLAFDPKSNR